MFSCLIYYYFGLLNVFADFVVCPMQGGEKGDKDGDFPIDKGSLVQQGFVKIVS